jgi:hypothetical protein
MMIWWVGLGGGAIDWVSHEQYLVVYVGDVHDEVDLVVEVVRENAANDVCRDIVAGVAEVALVVDGRAAGVPGDLAGLNWHEGNGIPRLQGAVDLERLHGGDRRGQFGRGILGRGRRVVSCDDAIRKICWSREW